MKITFGIIYGDDTAKTNYELLHEAEQCNNIVRLQEIYCEIDDRESAKKADGNLSILYNLNAKKAERKGEFEDDILYNLLEEGQIDEYIEFGIEYMWNNYPYIRDYLIEGYQGSISAMVDILLYED